MARKSQPDAKHYRPDPAYITELVEKCKANAGFTNQADVARQIGIGTTTLKDWKAGRSKPSYCDQYVMETLAGMH